MHINITRLRSIANLLSTLDEEFVFVGGAVVSLYPEDPNFGAEIRPTDDIDVVVEIATYADYTRFDEKLRGVGFVNDSESKIICRYRIQGITVDFMPLDRDILGFSNIWYPEGFKNAIDYDLGQGLMIKIFSLPYFIASKWEAFKNRGKSEYRTSKDLEDMVYIFENVMNIEKHFLDIPQGLIEYFKSEFIKVIEDPSFKEGVYAHMENTYFDQDADSVIIKFKNVFKL